MSASFEASGRAAEGSKSGNEALRFPVGAVSPLWFFYAGAAGAGVAYWLLTRWARPVNLEQLLGKKAAAAIAPMAEAASAAVETTEEVMAAAVELVEETIDEAAAAAAAVIDPVIDAAETRLHLTAPDDGGDAPRLDMSGFAAPVASPEPEPAKSAPAAAPNTNGRRRQTRRTTSPRAAN